MAGESVAMTRRDILRASSRWVDGKAVVDFTMSMKFPTPPVRFFCARLFSRQEIGWVSVEKLSRRELEIRLKSGYFEDSNTRRNSEIRFSISSTPPTIRQSLGWVESTASEKSYYFNGKYWRKIVFMFIVMQKKRISFLFRAFHSSFFAFFFSKLLFIIISPFFLSLASRAKWFLISLLGFAFWHEAEEFMCAVKGKESFILITKFGRQFKLKIPRKGDQVFRFCNFLPSYAVFTTY